MAIGIGVVSAAVGALLALLPAALLVTTVDGPRALLAPALYASTMPVGAICGAVLGPVAAFGFMRRVPLGQMMVETATGTMAGWGAAYER